MKLVVTGASGFLGREVCLAALRRGHDILALGGTRAPTIPGVTQARAFDLCSEATLEALLLEEFPQAVVHCAALPTIETCLADPARAQALNSEVPKKLAQLCFHLGAKLVHLSTDTVFDGVAGNYQPTDQPIPLNLYGETKAAAEVEVLRYGREHAAVLRTSPIIGNSVGGDRGLHERLFASWKEGKVTTLFTDEIRQPVEVSNLADVTIELCGHRSHEPTRDRCPHRSSLRTRCRYPRATDQPSRSPLRRIAPARSQSPPAPAGRQASYPGSIFRRSTRATAHSAWL
jgi:dTDP-4-dehydrorhamnose reductase